MCILYGIKVHSFRIKGYLFVSYGTEVLYLIATGLKHSFIQNCMTIGALFSFFHCFFFKFTIFNFLSTSFHCILLLCISQFNYNVLLRSASNKFMSKSLCAGSFRTPSISRRCSNDSAE